MHRTCKIMRSCNFFVWFGCISIILQISHNFLWIGFCLTGPISLCVDLFVFVCICVFFVSYCIVVVSLWARWGGPDGIEAWSFGPIFLQCFDTVGWVIWPVKPVSEMTYNVSSGTLNLTMSMSMSRKYWLTGCRGCLHSSWTWPLTQWPSKAKQFVIRL